MSNFCTACGAATANTKFCIQCGTGVATQTLTPEADVGNVTPLAQGSVVAPTSKRSVAKAILITLGIILSIGLVALFDGKVATVASQLATFGMSL